MDVIIYLALGILVVIATNVAFSYLTETGPMDEVISAFWVIFWPLLVLLAGLFIFGFLVNRISSCFVRKY